LFLGEKSKNHWSWDFAYARGKWRA
jgi:hypothetical protein